MTKCRFILMNKGVCDHDFYRKGNVDIVCARYEIPVYNTLDGAIGRLRTELKNVN